MDGPDGEGADILSHRRHWSPGVVQRVSPAGRIDLVPGYLEPGLLPVGLVRDAYARALAEFGSAALSYGNNQGAHVLRSQLARRASGDGSGCGPEHILVTAGTSHALYLLATSFGNQGDVVLVDQFSYDLGRRILTDSGLRTRAVAADHAGMDPRALHDTLAAARGRVAFLLLNPTFHNPTGTVVPLDRRRELLAVAERHGVLVVEDDAYAEVDLDGLGTTRSMADLSGYRGVIRLGTFSKTLAPGLRLGWLLADPAMVERFTRHGLFDSGGSANHVASLAVASMLRSGDYDRHLARLLNELRARRDALAGGLRAGLGGRVEFDVPQGGYFLWLRFPDRSDDAGLLAAAQAAGVEVAAGSRFGDSSQGSVRLAYTFNSPGRLAHAARLLAGSWRSAGPTEERMCS